MQDIKNGELNDLEFTRMVAGINEGDFDLTLLKEDKPRYASNSDEEFNELDWNEARKSRNYIKAFKLVNLQSWPDDMGWIDLETPGVTVFQARSETGKSVFFKACDCMCFPTRFGISTRRSLIRRGFETGSVEIKLSNDTIIKCEFHKTKNVYTRTDAQGNVTSYPPCNNLPDELARELGWFVNYNTKQLLNLIDDNNGRFFIQGSAKDSAEVLKVITQNRILTEASDNVTNWTKSLIEKDREVVPALNAVRHQLQATPYIDADELRKEVSLAEGLGNAWKQVSYLSSEAYILGLEVEKKPAPPVDLSLADSLMEALEELETIKPAVVEMENLIANKPVDDGLTERDYEVVGSVLDAGDEIVEFNKSVDDMISLVNSKPSMEGLLSDEAFDKADSLIEACEKITALQESVGIMERLVGLKPPEVNLNLDLADSLIEAYDKIGGLSQAFVEYVETLRQYVRSKQETAAIANEIKVLEDKLGVCPLCGASFKGGA